MSPSSGLKMETVCISKTLASPDKSTWRQNPDHQHHHPHGHENLKSHKIPEVYLPSVASTMTTNAKPCITLKISGLGHLKEKMSFQKLLTTSLNLSFTCVLKH
jgi:hypothetical protein